MNLAGIANSAIQSILPNLEVTLKKYVGFTINEYGERFPCYLATAINAQVQELKSTELSYAEKMGIQGQLRTVYIHSPYSIIANMQGESGGDLIYVDGVDWLVITLTEAYPDYSKGIIQRQSSIQDAYTIDGFLTDDSGNFITQDNGGLIIV